MSDRRHMRTRQWARPGEKERDLRKTNGELCCQKEIDYRKRDFVQKELILWDSLAKTLQQHFQYPIQFMQIPQIPVNFMQPWNPHIFSAHWANLWSSLEVSPIAGTTKSLPWVVALQMKMCATCPCVNQRQGHFTIKKKKKTWWKQLCNAFPPQHTINSRSAYSFQLCAKIFVNKVNFIHFS